MENNNSKKKIIISVMVITSLVIFALCCLYIYFRVIVAYNEGISSDYPDANKMVEALLFNDVSYYDMNEIDEYLIKDPSFESIKEDYPAIYYFCNGMVRTATNDNDAGEYLNKALKELSAPYYDVYYEKDTFDENLGLNNIHIYSDLARRISARCYYELARMCINLSQFDMAYNYYGMMLGILDEEKDIRDVIWLSTWASYDMGVVLEGRERAITLLLNAYDLAVKYDYYMQTDLLVALADSYKETGDIVMFVVTAEKAIEWARQENDSFSEIMVNNSIGLEYLDEYSYDMAMRYLMASYSIELVDNELEYYMKTYTCCCIAQAYIRKGDYAKALEFIDEAERYRKQQTDEKSARDDFANILALRAEYEIENGDANEALKYLEQAYDIFNNSISFSYSNFDYGLCELYGRAYLKLEDYDKAIFYFNRAYDICVESGALSTGREIYGLAEAYRKEGNVDKAYEFTVEYEQFLIEKVYNSQNNQAGVMLEEFQSNQKDDEILRLSTRTRLYTLIIVMSIVLILFAIFGAYGNYKHSKKIGLLNEELIELSERDGLTGIYNRRKLDEYLTEKWNMMGDTGYKIGVIMIDVDFFKPYNDFYGHLMGDNALMAVAGILQSVTSNKLENPSDSFVARYGGEEFILIFPRQSKASLEMIIQNIRIQLRNLNIEHQKSKVDDLLTISMGCTLIDNDSEGKPSINYEQAINKADEALYEAKQTRNTYCFKL